MIVVTIFRLGEPDEVHQFPETQQAAAIALAMDSLLRGLSITFVRQPDVCTCCSRTTTPE